MDNIYRAAEVNGYPMVFIGPITGGFNATLGTAQLDWLESTLKACARRDRPTLLFCHQPIYNVVDAAGLRQILRATPNVIYVWGHWHTDLNWYTQGPDTRQVQCPATTYVGQYAHRPDGGTSQTFQADMRQGLVIDVYDSGVVVRGRDFSRHEWVPGFQATIPVNAPAHHIGLERGNIRFHRLIRDGGTSMPIRSPASRPTAGTRSGGRLLALVGPVVLVAGAASACGTSGGQASAPAPSVTAPASAGADIGGNRSTAPTKSATATGHGQVAPCTAADIKPTVIGQAQRTSGATRMAIVELTNASAHPCRLEGWASVTLVDAAGQLVQVPTVKVAQPGAPVPVDLAPGTSASAGIKWTACDKASADCPTGNGLQVGLPRSTSTRDAELSEFPAAEKSDITMKSLQLGSIQPSHQGVVAW